MHIIEERMGCSSTEVAFVKVAARVIVIFVALVAAVGGSSRAALALIANGWTTPPRAYSGVCPTNPAITLNGMITGNPGTSVQWNFSYLNPATGKTVSLPTQTGTLDSSGTLQVAASVTFDATMAGNSWVKLFAQAGTVTVTSTSTSFSVTCTSTAPGPPPPQPPPPAGGNVVGAGGAVDIGGALPITGAFIPAPTGLTYTTDPTVCAPHNPIPLVGGPECQSFIRANKIVLIWNWSNASCPSTAICPSDVDGYRVYRYPDYRQTLNTNPGASIRLTDIQGGTGVTMAALDSGGWSKDCFSVTAFKAGLESNYSYIFCTPGGVALGSKTINLQPARIRETKWWYESNSGVLGGTLPGPTATHTDSPAETQVGYGHGTQKAAIGDWYRAAIYRTYILFDLQQFQGKAIQKAILHLHEDSTDRNVAEDALCAKYFGTASEDWESAGGSRIYADFPNTLPWRGSTGDLAIDVTDQVRAWFNGAQNFGFAFKGSDEGNPFNDNYCITKYSGVSLDVEYFQ